VKFCAFDSWLIARGFVPKEIEDKWFVYRDNERLLFRRKCAAHAEQTFFDDGRPLPGRRSLFGILGSGRGLSSARTVASRTAQPDSPASCVCT
jgi:hypothetical protein